MSGKTDDVPPLAVIFGSKVCSVVTGWAAFLRRELFNHDPAADLSCPSQCSSIYTPTRRKTNASTMRKAFQLECVSRGGGTTTRGKTRRIWLALFCRLDWNYSQIQPVESEAHKAPVSRGSLKILQYEAPPGALERGRAGADRGYGAPGGHR